MNGNVSILVPARNEEGVLPVTLPTILKAAAQLPSPAEVLVISPASSPVHADPPVRDPMLRWIVTRRPGKFEALRVGADAARGDKLVFIDADVIVEPRTVANLTRPIAAGQADVAAGRIDLLAQARTPMHRLLERWSSVSARAWDLMRTSHPEFLWALPGAIYAMRRELFPSRLVAPLVDDASIGLAAMEAGAGFTYASDALVRTPAPPTYPAWVHQKLRSRRGWAELAKVRADEVAALERCLRGYFAIASSDEPTRWLMRMQDHLLRRGARALTKWGPQTAHGWVPRRNESSWKAHSRPGIPPQRFAPVVEQGEEAI